MVARLCRCVLWLVFLLLLVLGGLFAFSVKQVADYARYPVPASLRADAAVVLGAAAWGVRPSPVFRERINHGIALYQSGQVDKLVFTGGTPKPGFMTEAEVARRFALKQGVPPADILLETTSKDTYENLRNTQALMRRHGLRKVLVVSDPYHMARAAAMAADLGIAAEFSPTPTSRFNDSSSAAQKRFFWQESYALFVFRLWQAAKAVGIDVRQKIGEKG